MRHSFGRVARLLIGSLLAAGGVAALLGSAVSSDADHRQPVAFSAEPSQGPQVVPSPSHSTPASPARTRILQPFQADRLQIRALQVDAPVGQIFTTDGVLDPPADPRQVGWWAGSMLAGSAQGSSVLVGHVDTAADGLGALYLLDKARPGMLVRLTGASRSADYRIDSLSYYPKTSGLPRALFSTTGAARLVLISCGGSFDTTTRSYRDNVVVTAELVS